MADDEQPTAVGRLVTTVDLDRRHPGPRQLWLSALLEVVLVDGRRVLLLDDRGGSTSGLADLWVPMSAAEIEETARVVVGPDEPAPGRTQEQVRAGHWDGLPVSCHGPGSRAPEPSCHSCRTRSRLTERLRARLSGSGEAVPDG